MASMTRTFIALDLGAPAREALRRELRRLARILPDVRLADPADLHLTLVFLGELDDMTLGAVNEVASAIAQETKPFQLALSRLGTFGPPTAPRVIWAGVVGDTGRLLKLQRRLADALADLGFPREQRPFAPHLTLARLKRPLTPEQHQRLGVLLAGPGPRSPRWRVTDLRVMRSDLNATGARYTPMLIAPLAGSSARDA